jgi:hypothetical protein
MKINKNQIQQTETVIEIARFLKSDFEKLVKLKSYKFKPEYKKWIRDSKEFLGYPPTQRPLNGLLFYQVKQIANQEKTDNPYGLK